MMHCALWLFGGVCHSATNVLHRLVLVIIEDGELKQATQHPPLNVANDLGGMEGIRVGASCGLGSGVGQGGGGWLGSNFGGPINESGLLAVNVG